MDGRGTAHRMAYPPTLPDFMDYWTSGPENPDSWSDEEKDLREVPQYVFDYAPYVHLFSRESFWPCDLAEHLVHTSPHLNYTKITDLEFDVNLTNLHELNDYNGGSHRRWMYLKSDDNVEERPQWLGGAKNIPSSPESDIAGDEQSEWPGTDNSKTFSPDQRKTG